LRLEAGGGYTHSILLRSVAPIAASHRSHDSAMSRLASISLEAIMRYNEWRNTSAAQVECWYPLGSASFWQPTLLICYLRPGIVFPWKTSRVARCHSCNRGSF